MNTSPFVDSVTTPAHCTLFSYFVFFFFFVFVNLDVFVCVVFVDGAVVRCVVIVDWISTQKINANPLAQSVAAGVCE